MGRVSVYDRGYALVSDTELADALVFAKKGKRGDCGYPSTDLDKDFLRLLADRTRALMKTGVSLYDAKTQVLNGNFRERSRAAQERRRAYSAAISHLFGKRNRFGKRGKARRVKRVYPADERGQYTIL